MRPRILIIYTGGTIGSLPIDPKSPASDLDSRPFMESLENEYCRGLTDRMRLVGGGLHFDLANIQPPIDSSRLRPDKWIMLARIIESEYSNYSGFVVLHGTDTLARTATALAFMFETLDKPIVITGSQVPLFKSPTDARSNLLNALWVASRRPGGHDYIPEVSVVFGSRVLRGCQTTKVDASAGDAFDSPNGEHLGVIRPGRVHVHSSHVLPPRPVGIEGRPRVNYRMYLDEGSALDVEQIVRRAEERAIGETETTHLDGSRMEPVRVFSITAHEAFCWRPLKHRVVKVALDPDDNIQSIRDQIAHEDVKGVLLGTHGLGNAPEDPELLECLREASDRECLVVNVSRCLSARVEMGRYAASSHLLEYGVVSGMDMTDEAARAKIRWALQKEATHKDRVLQMQISRRGEQGEDLFDVEFRPVLDEIGQDGSHVITATAARPASFDKERLTRSVLRFRRLRFVQAGEVEPRMFIFFSNQHAVAAHAPEADIQIRSRDVGGPSDEGRSIVRELDHALASPVLRDNILIRLVTLGGRVEFDRLNLALFARPGVGIAAG